MSFLEKITGGWRSDSLLRRVLGSSAVLMSSNSFSLALSVLQSILVGRLLGPAGFGLVGIIMGYSSTVNGLLSFRMSELVVRYGGEYLENGEHRKVSALVKAAALGEASVSFLAFLFIFLTAGLAARFISKSPEDAWLFVVFAFGLLANFNAETSTGVLQVLDKIKIQGVIHLVQSVFTACMIVYAYLYQGDLLLVLIAYLAGKIILGFGLFTTAFGLLTRRIGAGWWRESFRVLPEFRNLARFGLSSNLSATVILLFRESEILWVGFFLNNTAAGYFKAAYGIASLLSIPANPLILSTYPEINRLVIQKAWGRLRGFLRKISSLAGFYNILIATGFVLFGKLLLSIYGEPYTAAFPALIAMLVGLVFNYVLFWNRPLLLALGNPEYPIKATLVAGLAKTALAFPLVPRYGIVAEAALLSFYYIGSVSGMVWRGYMEIHRLEKSTSTM